MLLLENVKIYTDITKEEVIDKALKKYRIDSRDVSSAFLYKKAIDARDKNNVHYLYSVAVNVGNEGKYPRVRKADISDDIKVQKRRNSSYRPVIVGSGPAGLFCALLLAENGYKPIILERGDCVENRIKYVEDYRKNGILNPSCNVQFGEGGAGTFSDGKLATGIHSPYIRKVLSTFHRFGGPEEIMYLSHPHIGTDNLVNILVNIRRYIESLGGSYYFNTRMDDFKADGNLITVECGDKEFITDTVVLAVGHSARDTFEMLLRNKLDMKQKNFSVGVRIEHLQRDINEAQYGNKTVLKLPAAEYKLVRHIDERTCYTFCMCPGGEVIASSSEEGCIVTNGMSNFARDGENANSAVLVNVSTSDLNSDDVLAGAYFQKELEQNAYQLGGNNGCAPIQRFEDFCLNRKTNHLGRVKPSYKPGYSFSNLNEILPDYVSETLKQGIKGFARSIKGFDDPDAILTGVETRTSSPITVIRNDDLMSSVNGIYPCGEGCGYAGGITSAAVDGIKVAIKIMEKSE